MGFLNFSAKDVNKGYKEYKERETALLIDVRCAEEFASGHIPGAINIPVSKISNLCATMDRNAPIFTYCLSGARSTKASAELIRMGFSEVHNIGGISTYEGQIER